MSKFYFSAVCFSINLLIPGLLNADSVYVKSRKLEINFSGSAAALTNWNGESIKSLSLFFKGNYNSTFFGSQNDRILDLKTELGYNWLIDSLLKKNMDQFNLQYFVKKSGKKVSRSVNAGLRSQLLTGYSYESDLLRQKIKRKWNGTFLNPSSVEFGCGMSWGFWNYSLINISVASARLRVEPAVETFQKPGDGTLGKMNRGWFLFDYGLSGQLLLNKNLTPRLEWNGTGKMFMKGIRKEQISFDLSNSMRLKIRKYAALTADLKCVYEPLLSLRMQYRNELLVGLVFLNEK